MTALDDLVAACNSLATDTRYAVKTRALATTLGTWAATFTPPLPVSSPAPAPVFGAKLDEHLPRLPRPTDQPTLMSPLQGSNVGALVKKVAGGEILEIPAGTYWWELYTLHPAKPVLVRPAPGAEVFLNVGSSGRVHGMYNADVSNLIVEGREPNGGTITCRGNPNDGFKYDNVTDSEFYWIAAIENKREGFLASGLGSATPASWTNKFSRNVRHDGLTAAGNESHGFYIGGGSANSTSQAGLDTFLFVNCVGYDNNGVIPYIYDMQFGGMAWNGIIANCTADQLNPHTTTSGYHHGLYVIYNQADQPWPSRSNIAINNLGSNTDLHGFEGSGHSGAQYATSNVLRENMMFAALLGEYQPLFGTTPVLTVESRVDPVDPLYVNPQGRDYRLRPGSPAAGIGDPDYMPPFDHDGKPRTIPALGAYA